MILDHYRATLAREPRDNLLRMHFMDMKRDPLAAIARIAGFLGLDDTPELLQAVHRATAFDSMRASAHRYVPGAGRGLWHDEQSFFRVAGTRRWRDILTPADLAAYDARMAATLSAEERRWLEAGSARQL